MFGAVHPTGSISITRTTTLPLCGDKSLHVSPVHLAHLHRPDSLGAETHRSVYHSLARSSFPASDSRDSQGPPASAERPSIPSQSSQMPNPSPWPSVPSTPRPVTFERLTVANRRGSAEHPPLQRQLRGNLVHLPSSQATGFTDRTPRPKRKRSVAFSAADEQTSPLTDCDALGGNKGRDRCFT